MTNRRYAIIEAPSVLGLKPTGVEILPEALLQAGLADRLGARQAAALGAPAWDGRRDDDTGLLNVTGIAEYSVHLADAVGRVIDAGECPIVLGGDCSIVLGNLLALKRRGRYGLLFIDGHADFYQPEANVNGEAASSDLALATGRGPPVLSRLEGYERLVQDDDVCVIGHRDAREAAGHGSVPLPPDMLASDLWAVRRDGVRAAVRSALERLTRPGLTGFWVHLDVDVLDDAIMPAVDYRQPDGLSWTEAHAILAAAAASGRMAGIDVTIYNPTLDPGRVIAGSLVDVLVLALSVTEHSTGTGSLSTTDARGESDGATR
jgi:arginase